MPNLNTRNICEKTYSKKKIEHVKLLHEDSLASVGHEPSMYALIARESAGECDGILCGTSPIFFGLL